MTRQKAGNRILIREAVQEDFPFVSELMYDALEPFYGGDHRAHAERIFKTHISGGQDRLGHFSSGQKMFIAEINGKPGGVLHIVVKRQNTHKISPLIVAPEYRCGVGVGNKLLRFAEQYAFSSHARQLYCTVAERNYAALQFFLRHGFIRAGFSDSHYKIGEREHMLYKPIEDDDERKRHDDINLSIVPYERRYSAETTKLIIGALKSTFLGVDESWVQSMYDGYERRHNADVNAKYKLIYVVTDTSGKVHGVVGATPKKGEPIKLMPLVATDDDSFEAMLRDVPHMLSTYGHKLYTHLVPSATQTNIMQQLGWVLDAAMPNAYKVDVVTQQWSLSLEGEVMRNMRVKKRFYDLIMSGSKDLEVRVAYDNIKTISAGEAIRISTHDEASTVIVKDVRTYSDFASMLEREDRHRIVPDERGPVLDLLRRIYSTEKEKLGVIVLEITPDKLRKSK